MNISKHFSLKEMTMSPTATRFGIDNSPSFDVVTRMMLLAEKVLEPLREHMGEPVKVSSGYRSPVLNRKIGGSKTSQHCLGEAADLDSNGKNRKMFYFIKNNLEFDQLIWEFGDGDEPDWVHVSYKKENNRNQVLLAKKVNGKTVYEPYVG